MEDALPLVKPEPVAVSKHTFWDDLKYRWLPRSSKIRCKQPAIIILLVVCTVAWLGSLSFTATKRRAGSGVAVAMLEGNLTRCVDSSLSRLLVMRHCEKDETSERHCTPKGYRHAEWLSTQFGPSHRWPTPAALFARAPEPSNYVMRSVEMLTPLSEVTGVPIDSSHTARHMSTLVEAIETYVHTGKLCGRLAVVAWKHEQMAALISAWGYDFDGWHWKSQDFDSVIALNFTRSSSGNWSVAGGIEHQNFVDYYKPLPVSNGKKRHRSRRGRRRLVSA